MKGVMHKVYCELYKTDLTVCFHQETFQRRMNHYPNHDFGGCVFEDNGVINIYIEKINGGVNVSSCSHEAYHAADFIFERCGVKYNFGSGNEHVAYLVGWVVNKIFDCLEKDNEWESRKE